MSGNGHSPGPWTVVENHPGRANTPKLYIRNGEVGTVAVAQLCRKPLREREANARLIAAAPDLLEALREIAAIADPQTCLDPKSIVGNPIVGWNYALIAKRAIAKAENR